MSFPLKTVLLSLSAAVACYVSARLGLIFISGDDGFATVWAPTGIALAAVLLFGLRVWWGIFTGIAAATTLALLNRGIDFPAALFISAIISTGITLETLAGCHLVKKIDMPAALFNTSNNILRFAMAVLLMSVVGSFLGPAAFALGGLMPWEQYASGWFTWWLLDLAGILLLTPLILIWVNARAGKLQLRKALEAAGLFAAIVLLGGMVLGGMVLGGSVNSGQSVLRGYLVLPLLFWAAMRFGLREVTAANALLAAMAVWGVIQGKGPFVEASLSDSLISASGFIAVASILFLTLVAAIREQELSKKEIKGAHDSLQALMRERDEELLSSQKKLECFRERTDQLLQVLIKATQLDFSQKAAVSKEGDELDAIATGLNTMSEELNFYLRKLEESERRFKGLLESAPDGFVIVDKNGLIQLVNAQTEKMFGYQKNELLGKEVEILIPERFHTVHPEHRKNYFANPRIRGMGIGLDLSGRKKNGEEFPVEISLSPFETSEGTLVSAAIRDTTGRKQVEEQIRYQASLISNIQDAIISSDKELKILSWNKGAEKTYGWAAEEVLGKEASLFLSAEFPGGGTKEKALQELKEKGFYFNEVIQRTRDGRTLHILASVNAIKNEKGEISGIVAINRDITRQKEIEQKVKESEERFRGLLENAPDAIVITDDKGAIQLVNVQTEKMFGYSRKEMIGKKVEMLIPSRFKEVHSTHRDKYFEAPKSRGMGIGLDLWGRKKNGDEFSVEISLSPLKTETGILVSAAIRDITARRLSEEKIRYQANLIGNIQDAIISTDTDLIIRSWNKGAEKIYGWKAEEVIGKEAGKVLFTERLNGSSGILIQWPRVNGSFKEDILQSTKEGRRINIFSTVNAIRNEKGEISGIVAINRDVTFQKESERKVKESEEKFNKAFQASPAGIAITRLSDLKIIEVNESFLRITGYSREEIIGHTPVEIGLLPGPGTREKALEEVQQGGSANNMETELKHKSGHAVNVLISIDSVLIKNQKHSIMVISDITGQKKAEQLIRENQLFIGQLTETSPDIISVQDIIEGKVVYANSNARKFYGFSEDEPYDLKKVLAGIHPEDLTRVKEYREKFRSMKNQEMQEIEFRIKNKDGNWRWILSSSMVIRRNEKGAPQYILSISRDISRRKEAEEQIQTIFHNAPEAVILIDQESIIREWNPFAEKIFGWKKEEVLGKHLYETIIPQRFRNAHIEGLKNYIRTGEEKILNRPLELPALRKDNAEFDAGINISPLLFRGRKFFIGFVTDISPRKKAEDELKKKSEELLNSNKELEQFAYVASHDLQEPLRMVSSYVQLLERRYKDKLDDDANDFIHYAVDGSNRMRKLINSLLEYSRVNRVKPFEKIDANQLMQDVLFDLKEVIEENKAEIIIDTLPEIFGDPVLIARLFQNLIGNAIKFRSEKPPVITVSGKSANGHLLFSVKDNGIGIAREYFEKIFVIFQRLHTKDKYPGTGIGLAICKKIVERHGGKIWVESKEGQGSAFYFTLKTNVRK